MNGGENRQPLSFGYTIIEVMITLAITGVMFIVAVIFIQGRQQQVEFRQAVSDFNSKINTTINDVTNGYYPSSVPFSCSGTPTGPSLTYNASPAQGTNNGCIFLGKVMHFRTDQGDDHYEILSVAGDQFNGGNPVSSLQTAYPTAIYQTGANSFDATDKQVLNGGLTVNGISEYTVGGARLTPDSYAFGIFTNLSTSATTSGLLTSGAASIGLYDFDTTSPHLSAGQSEAAAVSGIPHITDSDAIDKVIVCVTTGSHNAYITIGGEGKLSTDITWEQPCP